MRQTDGGGISLASSTTLGIVIVSGNFLWFCTKTSRKGITFWYHFQKKHHHESNQRIFNKEIIILDSVCGGEKEMNGILMSQTNSCTECEGCISERFGAISRTDLIVI